MLTELARQVGLAFHNVQLDSALQTTLDELRKQADELRESRARIVASGRRRAPPGGTRPARRRPAAPGGAGREPPPGPGHRRRRPGRGRRDARASWPTTCRTTIQELRELAHGIYPPLLVDSGLPRRAARRREPQPAHGRA